MYFNVNFVNQKKLAEVLASLIERVGTISPALWYKGSQGDNLSDALIMAEDVLAFYLYDEEKAERKIPTPSAAKEFKLGKNEFVNYIACDTAEYAKRNNNRAVKKTLTVPEWLSFLVGKIGGTSDFYLYISLSNSRHFSAAV